MLLYSLHNSPPYLLTKSLQNEEKQSFEEQNGINEKLKLALASQNETTEELKQSLEEQNGINEEIKQALAAQNETIKALEASVKEKQYIINSLTMNLRIKPMGNATFYLNPPLTEFQFTRMLWLIIIDRVAKAKQGDNALGSVSMSVLPSVCLQYQSAFEHLKQ